MNEIEALHTAARRYCLDEGRRWRERYADLQRGREQRVPYSYSRRDLDTFPRYHVLDAIRVDIELYVPADFASPTEAVDTLVIAAETAESLFTRPDGPIESRAIEEERAKAVAHFRSLGEEDLRAIRPLPYRRTLGTSEAEDLRRRLAVAWEANDNYWYPLVRIERRDVRAFHARAFLADGGGRHLRLALRHHGLGNVFALREIDRSFEVKGTTVEWIYDFEETFWTDDNLDWVVYASHDDSLAVGGWLLGDLQSSWPDCRRHAWLTTFDT